MMTARRVRRGAVVLAAFVGQAGISAAPVSARAADRQREVVYSRYKGPSPLVAALLPVSAPVATSVLLMPHTSFNVVLGSLTMGTGHLYAGDPERALWVSLGSTAVFVGTSALFFRIEEGVRAAQGPTDHAGSAGTNALIGGLALAAYGLWAAYDAMLVASRNQILVDVQGMAPAGASDVARTVPSP